MKQALNIAVLAFAISTTGCKEDLLPLTTLWQSTVDGFSKQVSGFEKQHGDLVEKAKALAASAAELGAQDPTQEARAKLDEALKSQGTSLASLKDALAKAGASVNAAVEGGKLQALQQAIDGAKTQILPKLSEFGNDLGATSKQIADAEIQLTSAKGQLEAAKQAVLEAEAKLKALTTQGGKLDFSDIDFEVGTAKISTDKASSKSSLDRLVAFGKTCKEMRFNLAGHSSQEGDAKANQKLSEARANAVKDYLVGQGVNKKSIVKTMGFGSKYPLVEEPEAGSEKAKAMPAADLEALRNKNRRIEVQVTVPCKLK